MQAHDAAGRPILPRVRKTRAILAMLGLAAPRPILRTQFIALLWSRRDLQQARGSLRQALHELHDDIGELCATLLDIDRFQVGLRTSGLEVDVNPLDRAAPGPFRHDGPRLLEDLGGIDPAFDVWLGSERRRVAEWHRTQAEAALRSANHPEQAITLEDTRAALADASQLQPSAATRARLVETRAGSVAPRIERTDHSPVTGRSHLVISHPERTNRVRVGVTQIRVLPGGAAEELAAGLAEELVAALACFRSISCIPIVVPPPSHANGLASDLLLGDQFGLDFLLDGSVQRSGEQIRAITRLRDLRTAGEVVWCGRFDRSLAGILDLQEEIASATVAQLEPKLLLWEGERTAALRLCEPSAQDLLRMAIPALFRLNRSGFQAAGEKLERSLRTRSGASGCTHLAGAMAPVRGGSGLGRRYCRSDPPRTGTGARSRGARPR